VGDPIRPAVAGLLLTGGASSRMGRDKARIGHPSGVTWAERAGALLAAVAAPVLELGPGVSGLPAVADDEPGEGPLAAVACGWSRLQRLGPPLATMVVACDLPLLTPELLALLAGWPSPTSVVPLLGGRPQWCCARYSPACLQRAAELVAAGRRDLRALGEAAGAVTWLGPGELGAQAAGLVDADTPGQLAALGLQAPGGAPSAGAGAGALSRGVSSCGTGFGTVPA
jgi:molybdopterin-guanine dinucleotide biosynthesis protein A